MASKIMMLAVACVLAASPAVWAASNDAQSAQSETQAFLQWQAQRDAAAKARLAGAQNAPEAKADAVQSMWYAPVKTDDAVPTEDSADQKAAKKDNN